MKAVAALSVSVAAVVLLALAVTHDEQVKKSLVGVQG